MNYMCNAQRLHQRCHMIKSYNCLCTGTETINRTVCHSNCAIHIELAWVRGVGTRRYQLVYPGMTQPKSPYQDRLFPKWGHLWRATTDKNNRHNTYLGNIRSRAMVGIHPCVKFGMVNASASASALYLIGLLNRFICISIHCCNEHI